MPQTLSHWSAQWDYELKLKLASPYFTIKIGSRVNSDFAYRLEQILFFHTGNFGSQSNMHTPNKFYSFLMQVMDKPGTTIPGCYDSAFKWLKTTINKTSHKTSKDTGKLSDNVSLIF